MWVRSPPGSGLDGGLVVFTKHTFDAETAIAWSVWRDHFATGDWGQRMEEAFTSGNYGHQLWPGLDVRPEDIAIQKYRFSAFVRDRPTWTRSCAGVTSIR